VWAQQPSETLPPAALKEIAEVEAEIDRIEAQTLERLTAPPDNEVQQVELLGKAMLYDKQLSVSRNEACAFCHMPETGFTGPVSELNRTTVSFPGSVRTRFSNRKPQTHSYAPLSPVLHYNAGQGDMVGGNFWDMRATGRRLGNPAAEQAEGRPTNPVEMGLHHCSIGCWKRFIMSRIAPSAFCLPRCSLSAQPSRYWPIACIASDIFQRTCDGSMVPGVEGVFVVGDGRFVISLAVSAH
jgi:cytochrome c peroxidase